MFELGMKDKLPILIYTSSPTDFESSIPDLAHMKVKHFKEFVNIKDHIEDIKLLDETLPFRDEYFTDLIQDVSFRMIFNEFKKKLSQIKLEPQNFNSFLKTLQNLVN